MNKLREVSAAQIIELPLAESWRKLSDLSIPHRYVPKIVRTEMRGEQTHGVGATRRVWQKNGQYLDETVEEWNEGSGFLIRLHRDNEPMMPIFSEAFFRYRLEDSGNERTLATTSLLYALRRSNWIMERMLAFFMRRQTRAVVLNLKRYYEGSLGE